MGQGQKPAFEVAERIRQLIADKGRLLEQAGIDQGRTEIELILCHLLKVDRLNLYQGGAHLIDDSVLKRLDEIVSRRVTRYPLQYILGESWFYGRRFHVSPKVMIPRPETEVLCETAIRFAGEAGMTSPRVLDLGVGSGVISVTVACELEHCSVLALDISEEALRVAKMNAAELGAADRIEFCQSDFFASVEQGWTFDLILSNPPYISGEEYKSLPPEVLADPEVSLLGGEDGLDAIKVILRSAPAFLAEGGLVILEIGDNQADRVTELAADDGRYRAAARIKDLSGVDRVIMLSRA